VVEVPAQIVLFEPAPITGNELTVTVTEAVSEQPLAFVPITLYVVVAEGDAVGLAQPVHDKPAEGDHE